MHEPSSGTFDFKLLGAVSLTAPDGRRVALRSRKGLALLALLATAERGERTRVWLQDKLWGSRDLAHAQTSLRRELTALRRELNSSGELIQSDARTVRLDLNRALIDVRSSTAAESPGEFLEGFDFAGEESFTRWLSETRATLAARGGRLHAAAGRGEEGPAGPGAPEPTLALAVLPIQIRGPERERLTSLASNLAHSVVKCITARKWLPIIIPRGMADEALEAELPNDLATHDARYVLDWQLLASSGSSLLSLSLKVAPSTGVLWTESLSIPDDQTDSALQVSIARLCNALLAEIFHAETRRIQLLDQDRLTRAERLHQVRKLLGHFSIDGLLLARSHLDQAIALGAACAEQVILDSYVEAMMFMGSDYREVDQARLRGWASAAIDADPTDWRGTLLASVIELWLGNVDLAILHAQRSNELCPWNSATLGLLGNCYNFIGQPQLALPNLDAALSLSLLERRPYLLLCNLAFAHLMQDRLGQALSFCDQAASCVPELGLAYLLKVEILVRLGRNSDAARVYAESIRDHHPEMIAMVRRQRVLPAEWIDRTEQSLNAAIIAAGSQGVGESEEQVA